MYGAARGLTDVLDPHSRFMDPEEYGQLKKETEGNEEIEGIGIDVEKRKNRFVIVSPIEGSPAARAGIEPGDVIKRVDGVDIATLEFDEAVSRMQGPARQRGLAGRRPPRARAVVPHQARALRGEGRRGPAARGRRRLRQDPRLLVEHRRRPGRAARSAVGQGQGRCVGLVLDMRRNPGGLLDQGIRVADRFIAEGLIVKTVGKGGHVMDEAKAHSRGTWSGFPMIVLVDGATASAAEIVAGALQDHGRAVVLGTQTFGKGSVQTVIDLDGCGGKPCGLKLTVARYYTPKRAIDPGAGDHAQHRRRRDARRRPTRSTPTLRASATCASGCATSRARSRRERRGWTTTSCRWRSTTCGRGRCSRSRRPRRSSADPLGTSLIRCDCDVPKRFTALSSHGRACLCHRITVFSPTAHARTIGEPHVVRSSPSRSGWTSIPAADGRAERGGQAQEADLRRGRGCGRRWRLLLLSEGRGQEEAGAGDPRRRRPVRRARQGRHGPVLELRDVERGRRRHVQQRRSDPAADRERLLHPAEDLLRAPDHRVHPQARRGAQRDLGPRERHAAGAQAAATTSTSGRCRRCSRASRATPRS